MEHVVEPTNLFVDAMRLGGLPARLEEMHAQWHTAWASGVLDWGDSSSIELLNVSISFRTQKFSEFAPQRLRIDTGFVQNVWATLAGTVEKWCRQTTVSNLIYDRITRKYVWEKTSFSFAGITNERNEQYD